jgi:Bifunctional DNA primase/polymerase, N-terminal
MMNSAILKELRNLPSSWRFTPVNGSKAPYLSGWQEIPLTFQELIDRHASDRRTHAVGLLTGVVSNGILAVDHDSSSCDPLIEKLSGVTLNKALPKTVGFSSDKLGRYQLLYQVPQLFWEYISNKTILTGVKDTDSKDEQIDFRWNDRQSFILGKHPDTGAYRWLEGYSPSQVQVTECPKWVIRQILTFRQLIPKTSQGEWSDRSQASEKITKTKTACQVADGNLITSQNDPRNAVTIDGDRVVVDEDKIDLNYQPEIPIPSWQPTKKLKPYESLSKLYLT